MAAQARRKLIAGNWKMNKTIPEGLALVRELKGLVASIPGDRVEVAVAPSFVALHAIAKELEGSSLKLAAQNCHWEASGAFTGEVSASMLKDVGCAYVIVGHSERRQYFGETDETVNKRTRAVRGAGMTPIICVGETLAEREANRTLEVVERQVAGALKGFPAAEVAGFVLAYEPVWAIGTGRTATSAQAQEVHRAIREQLGRLYDKGTAEQVRIQYGGSVKPDNAVELLGQPDVDGALVGGASLKAGDFAAIVKGGV
ncbi:triose-phosphate isomerase [Vitiosangium sp. GDMCC 1.1324]|uniref:triose-phosphate isomerase n=1 Tax=Vitiosangium sp. (strain GDMCC 1.1324) TaxID=2138576 RepID=UPI000D3D7860|nr:triose-phosphate isomerase [Vitiosangium sp. GDMCC 1.1324]PTL78061.1 triose-phosphate isomerase [Vitiosangium sp. GDMCC 1.1324]